MVLSDCINAKILNENKKAKEGISEVYMLKKKEAFVKKKVLSNGMTILVREVHNIPKVSLQVFYNVGSKDEKTGEKGFAHLIEHMVFKGTKKLSESDINTVVHKLSGSCNAFTSYDYTGYIFNMPTQHWKDVLPIMADCMTNCAFKDEHINSEMKAVIQEMKMIKDNFGRYLATEMLSLIFPDHPYHYPIIGYKQDLWGVNGDALRRFYKKHYSPNNATLVVVGDVKADEVFDMAEKNFGTIDSIKDYKKENFYFNRDIVSKSIVLYRDIKQPVVMLSFVIPGVTGKINHLLDATELILGQGKGSRLYKKIVDNNKLAYSLAADSFRLFDHGLFFIYFEPKNVSDIEKIESIIFKEIEFILEKGLTKKELERAIKQSKMGYYGKLEDSSSQAYDIGKYYVATGDENYAFNYLDSFGDNLEEEIRQFLSDYFRPSVMHKGLVLSLTEREKKEWKKLQEFSDLEDMQILSTRKRKSSIEKPLYAKNVKAKEPKKFDFPKAKTIDLSNGVKVLYYDNKNTPKINLVLELRAKYFYDPEGMDGLYNFVSSMMTEGTKNYTATQLADEIESRGMTLSVSPGVISMSMLHSDLLKGLEILEEILSRPAFNKDEIEKVRLQILSDIKNLWDDPNSISGLLIKRNLYKGHPYSKSILGDKSFIEKVKRKTLKKFYADYISPFGAKLAIVGDLSGYNLEEVLEEKFAKWSGAEVKEIEFPEIQKTEGGVTDYYINRDQVFISFANLSLDRKSEDYDKLVLFDQIFGGGSLGSMGSRLFKLREETGLFYTILGSLTFNSGRQPGFALVKTIVSLDRLEEAEKVIKGTIDTVADSVNDSELLEAKRAITNSLMNNFESNIRIANTFLFLERYDFSPDYFDNRSQELSGIELADVKEAVKKVLSSDAMSIVRVGRVGESKV